MADQKKVKTEGTYQEMEQATNLDKSTIQGAIELVEQTANIEVEVPEENKQK